MNGLVSISDTISDVTDDAETNKNRKKKVSFKEPLTFNISSNLAAAEGDDVFDKVSSNDKNISPKPEQHDVIKLPEISGLWWGEVDDGTTGEPQNNCE